MSSSIDKVFEEIFGNSPNKSGTAFEMLAAIVTHMLSGGDVKHDERLRGQFSKSLYQLDFHQKADNVSVMGEAKDYTSTNIKVGRDDIQKLAGALPDLCNIDSGIFFSATGYTKPAKEYANEAKNIIGKPITLYELRASTELDEQGFIKTIFINFRICIAQPENGNWLPHFTSIGKYALESLHKDGEEKSSFKVDLNCFYDKNGVEILSVKNLTSQGFGDINEETNSSHGCFILPNHYIAINEVRAEIRGLEYKIPYTYYTQVIRISDDSNNRLALVDINGNVIKIITDKKIKEYEFDENRNLVHTRRST